MPPKGWKKSKTAATAPTKEGPGEKILKDLDTKVKKVLQKGAVELTKAEAHTSLIPPGFERDANAPGLTLTDVVRETGQILSILVSARAVAGPVEVCNVLDKAIINTVNHLDRARAWLPLGRPEPEVTLKDTLKELERLRQEQPAASQEPAEAPKSASPSPTQAPAPIAAPAGIQPPTPPVGIQQQPAPYGSPPPVATHLPS